MNYKYKTILKYAECEYIIDKSRFIGYIKPINCEKEAEDFIEEIKNKHKNATHNVPVYLCGINNEIQRYSDDGEPSGTAGIPILEMLKNEGIKNIVVVVTRYFGGIKLGTGGLVRAYTHCTKMALDKATIINKEKYILYKIRIEYSLLGKIQSELLNNGFIIKDTSFDDAVNLCIYSQIEKTNDFNRIITNITKGSTKIEEIESKFLSILDNKIIE